MIPTYTGLMTQRMPLHLRGPRNRSRFSLQKLQHPGDLAQKWDPETSGSFVCSPRIQKAPRKTFVCIKLHKPTIYQKITLCAPTSWEISPSWWHYMSQIKKIHPFQMPSFYKILHSKIWQWLREDPDNSRDRAVSGNQWQSSIQPSSVFLQKEAMGSQGESHSTNPQKWYWWKNIFRELIYKCLELPIAEVLSS